MIETHLALMISQLTSSRSQENTELSAKIEQLKLNFKLPSVTQSRVTYFYDGNNSFSGGSSLKSSLACSNSASGHITPSRVNELLSEEEQQLMSGNKSWLVDYCIRHASIGGENSGAVVLSCLDLLVVVCRKYFDIFRKEVFFEDVCNLILKK